ncbi:hypothetical protein NPIL_396771, partial [Nephila pilipes]
MVSRCDAAIGCQRLC